MNANDRFALELGRALIRALVAEAELEQVSAELEELKSKTSESEKIKSSER